LLVVNNKVTTDN